MRLKSKDIAEILNISPSAVSLAINNKPGVSDETRRKVNSFIEEYYSNGKFVIANEDAREIKGTITLVIHKTRKHFIMSTVFFQKILDDIQLYTAESGYNLEISYYNPQLQDDLFICGLNEERIAGVLLLATEMTHGDLQIYQTLDKPMVALDARFVTEELDMVTLNNLGGMEQAVEYAYRMGHRDIGYLRSKVVIRNFEDRFSGYVEGLQRLGLPYDERFVFDVDCTIEGAYRDFVKILEKNKAELPTLFLTDWDCIMAGALRALKSKGYAVPDDVSLIGFDNMDFSAELDPPLTTLDVNPDIGKAGVKRLLEKINRDDIHYLNIEIAVRLLERNTVKKIER